MYELPKCNLFKSFTKRFKSPIMLMDENLYDLQSVKKCWIYLKVSWCDIRHLDGQMDTHDSNRR